MLVVVTMLAALLIIMIMVNDLYLYNTFQVLTASQSTKSLAFLLEV